MNPKLRDVLDRAFAPEKRRTPTVITPRLGTTKAKAKEYAKRSIVGIVELRGWTKPLPKEARFAINYAPRVSPKTGRIFAKPWSVIVTSETGSGRTRRIVNKPLGRFKTPALALAKITATYKPRNKAAVKFTGRGMEARFEREKEAAK